MSFSFNLALIVLPSHHSKLNYEELHGFLKCRRIAVIMFTLLFWAVSILGTAYAHVDSAKLTEECNIADICRHDQVPVCGIDSCGEMRTFIDTCDMHEFNCDSMKDFVQKPTHECWVTCKRGRSFKKPEFGVDCDIQSNLV